MRMLIVNLLIYGIVLFGLAEFFRRNHRAAWITFSAMPFLLLPWWIIHTPHSTFGWAKIFSVMLGITFMMAFRFTGWQQERWSKRLLAIILLVNILEAVIHDAAMGSIPNWINAAAGLLLIVTMPQSDGITVDDHGAANDILWDLPLAWIIGYTLWNITFIYLNWPMEVLIHVVVLGVPLIVSFIDNRLWIQTRAFTLGIFLITIFTYEPALEPILLSTEFSVMAAWIGATISLVWMGGYALQIGKQRLWSGQKSDPITV